MLSTITEIVGPPESGKSFVFDYIKQNYNLESLNCIRPESSSYPQCALLEAIADPDNFTKIMPWILAISKAAHYENTEIISTYKKSAVVTNYFWTWAMLAYQFNIPFGKEVLDYFIIPKCVIAMPGWLSSAGSVIPTKFSQSFRLRFESSKYTSQFINNTCANVLGIKPQVKILRLNGLSTLSSKYKEIDEFLPNRKTQNYTNVAYWSTS